MEPPRRQERQEYAKIHIVEVLVSLLPLSWRSWRSWRLGGYKSPAFFFPYAPLGLVIHLTTRRTPLHCPNLMQMSLDNEQHKGSHLSTKALESARRAGLEYYLLAEPLVVGVSGGADSLALLRILYTLRGADAARTLHIAHLDHGFRGEEGAEDARFVGSLAEEWGLPYTVRRFDVPAYARSHKLSPEEAVRRVRYAFLGALAAKHGAAVAVAHTADDQVETVLMNLLRGSGVSGLAGMRMLSHMPLPRISSKFPVPGSKLNNENLEPGTWNWELGTQEFAIFRPLLEVWRHEIEEYCGQIGLQLRMDITNADPTYTRNRIRHELLPSLEREYNPAIKERLLSLSDILAGEDQLIETLAEQEAKRIAHLDANGSRI